MLTRALPTLVVWVAVVVALDLPGVMAVADGSSRNRYRFE